MQLVSAFVRLNGDLGMAIPKDGLTVAEVQVLRAIHGPDAVVNIKRTGQDKRPHGPEKARLKNLYRPKIVEALWPGLNPRLPVTLDDIAVAPSMMVDPDAPAALPSGSDLDAGKGVSDLIDDAA